MQNLVGASSAPAFSAYAVTCLILCLNLVGLWVSSGAVRAKSGVAINPEDGMRYGAPVSEMDPPAVARLLRAHRNAEAMIYPFLFLGLLYVLAGGAWTVATPIFAVFTCARLAHSLVYVRGLQPWRTMTFATSLLALVVLMFALFYAVLVA